MGKVMLGWSGSSSLVHCSKIDRGSLFLALFQNVYGSFFVTSRVKFTPVDARYLAVATAPCCFSFVTLTNFGHTKARSVKSPFLFHENPLFAQEYQLSLRKPDIPARFLTMAQATQQCRIGRRSMPWKIRQPSMTLGVGPRPPANGWQR